MSSCYVYNRTLINKIKNDSKAWELFNNYKEPLVKFTQEYGRVAAIDCGLYYYLDPTEWVLHESIDERYKYEQMIKNDRDPECNTMKYYKYMYNNY